MSKKQIIFKIIEHKPTIPNINDYNFQITCYDTQFKDYIYCNKNNEIIDITSIKKSLKYIIKLTKNGKILGVGNLIINHDLFTKKIKRKLYNNINLFITENNYKKIFSQTNGNKIKQGLILTIEILINYNIIEKEKEKGKGNLPIQKKIKLIKRNLSFQNNNEYSIKSSYNYLTTSTSNINTYNNLNNCYDSDNFSENNLNFFSSDKLSLISPSNALSPTNISSPFSEPNLTNKKKKIIKKGIISSISFKNNNKKNKNLKIFSNNIKSNIFELKSKLNSSRNKKFIFNKNKINVIMTQETSSSKTTNTIITQSSIIDSALIEKENNFEIINDNKKLNINTELNNDIFIYNNISKYNKDNDDIDFYLLEIEDKKNKILTGQDKINKKLFYQQESEKKLLDTLNNYENKIDINTFVMNQMKEKSDLLRYKEDMFLDINKDITPIITEVKESKEIENDIINLILKSNEKNKENKNNNNINIIENNIQKYNKNLMIKIIKNVIQNNHDIDSYLNDEKKNKLKYICNKYSIFGTIIEDVEE